MKRFKVAATQVDVRHTDVEHNLEIHLQLIAEAAEAGCQLIVFPETSATGNNGSVEVTRFAEPHDGRIFETIRQQAKASAIVVSYGFCERFRGTHYNTSALVGPDGLIGLQRKVHASYDEFFRFRQAYEWGVYDLGFCTVGTAICHDSDFFESWRILALKGAEVILLPAREPDDAGRRRVLTFDGRENLLSDDQILIAQEELLEPRPDPAPPPRLPRPRQRRLCGVLRHGRVRRPQHPRRRRLRPRSRRLDARALGALDGERLDRGRARPRAARARPREPVVRAEEAPARGLRRADHPNYEKE